MDGRGEVSTFVLAACGGWDIWLLVVHSTRERTWYVFALGSARVGVFFVGVGVSVGIEGGRIGCEVG